MIDYLIFFVTSLGLHFSRKRAAVSPRTRGTLPAPWRWQNSFRTISECFMGDSLTALWHSSMTKSATWPTVMKPWLTALTKSWAVITKTLFFSNSLAHLEYRIQIVCCVAFGFLILSVGLFEISEPVALPQVDAQLSVIFAHFQTGVPADVGGLLLSQNNGGHQKNNTASILRQRPETLDLCSNLIAYTVTGKIIQTHLLTWAA